MSEQRLKQLLKETDIATAVGSPLLLEGFALYFDTQTKNCIAQLKWRNIDPRRVKAVMIELEGVDSFGRSAGRVKYTYEGLDTAQNGVFGDRVPIVIKTAPMTRCDVFLSAVSLDDGTVWSADKPMLLVKLPAAQPLPMAPELREQYLRDMKSAGHGRACANMPQNAMGLWQCGCGSWQPEGIPCLSCGATPELFDEMQDPAALEEHLVAYKAERERERIEAERKRVEDEKKRIAAEKKAEEQRIADEKARAAQAARNAKTTKLVLSITAVIVALALVFVLVIRPSMQRSAALKQGLEYLQAGDRTQARACFEEAKSREQLDLLDAYEGALASAKNGDYLAAIEQFDALNDYCDAPAQAEASRQAVYARADKLLTGGKTAEAYNVFTSLGDYAEAKARAAAIEADHAAAADLFSKGDYAAAKAAFEALTDYSDSAAKAAECEAQLAYASGLAALDVGDLKAALQLFTDAQALPEAAQAKAQLEAYNAAQALYYANNYTSARAKFAGLGDYLDSAAKVDECYAHEYEAAEAELTAGHIAAAHDAFAAIAEYSDSADRAAKIESDYASAIEAMDKGEWSAAVETLETLGDYLDSADKYAEACYAYAEELYAAGNKSEAEARYGQCGAYGDAEDKLVPLRTELAADAMAAKDYAEALRLYLLLPQTDDAKALEYKLAQTCYDEGAYGVAVQAYEALGQYELSVSKLPIARYAYADQLFENGEYRQAQQQFEMLNGTTDSADRAKDCVYALAQSLLESEKYDEAKSVFGEVKDHADAAKQMQECDYRKAAKLMSDGAYTEAEALFGTLGSYSDAQAQKNECAYRIAEAYLEAKDYVSAQSRYEALGSYADSKEKAKLCRYARGEEAFANGDYLAANKYYVSAGRYSDAAEKAKQSLYVAANALFDNGDYAGAKALYVQIGGYEDASDRYAECRLRQGVEKMDAGDYSGALTFLTDLKYGDSEERVQKCYIELGNAARVEGDYAKALSQYRSAMPGEAAVQAVYDMGSDLAAVNDIPKAIECLWAAGEDEASKALLAEISTLQDQLGNTELALIAAYAVSDHEMPENAAKVTGDALNNALQGFTLTQGDAFKNMIAYRHAQRLLTIKNWDEAKGIFTALGSYEDSAETVKECDYQKAAALLANGDVQSSYELFLTIKGYKDVDRLLVEDDNLVAAARAAARAPYTQVGNVVTYGHYEQDGNTSNGKEAIEWIVLSYDANKGEALLISKYGLEAKQYHDGWYYPTWERSDVRPWLNGDFLNAAFTSEEQKGIQTVKISTPSYSGNSGGNDTQDKIWLLSRDEAEEYFKSDKARQTTPTKYAVSTGAYQSSSYEIDGTGCCWWWLRSPGSNGTYASSVDDDGSLSGSGVDITDDVVRPAFVLNLASAVIS